MSLLDDVRARYGRAAKNSECLQSGTNKGNKSPSVGSVGSSDRHAEVFSQPVDLTAERQRRADLEARRARVLADLEANPDLERAWLATTMPDGTTVLTVAIRGTGSAELTVPAGRFDPFTFLKLTRKA